MLLDWTLIFSSRSNTQSGVPPAFWTSPPNTQQALTKGPDPVRPAEERVDLCNPAWQCKNWTRLHQEQFQGQIHSSLALGVWERAEACSRCPCSKVTEGWGVKGVALEKKKSCLTLEVRATWRWHLSLHSQLELVHLITKWGYNMYLLKHISTEKGRLRINWIHLY